MFNKLSPTPITNKTHRSLLIFTMIWFFSGAWIDSSAHTYLIDDIETFFTPWHGVLYSGYIFSALVVMYIKNTMKDYKFDVGVLGAVIFGIGGASDAIWHTLLGIETGVEPLITPSHLLLFLGAFLMLDYIFTTRPSKERLDNASIFSAATSYGLVLFITLFINPFLNIWTFIRRDDELAAGSVILQAMLASFIFIYVIRFKVSPKQAASQIVETVVREREKFGYCVEYLDLLHPNRKLERDLKKEEERKLKKLKKKRREGKD